MNTAKYPLPFFTSRRLLPSLGGAALAVVIVTATNASAQSVIAPSTPAANQSINASLKAAGASFSSPSSGSPFQWRTLSFRPHFDYRYLYGDGIHAMPGRQIKTSVQSISPGLLVEAGTRTKLDYTATQTLYSDDSLRDRLDHSANFSTGTGYGNLTLNLEHEFSDASTPLAETAAQTRLKTNVSELSADYSLGTRTGLGSSVSYADRSSRDVPAYREWKFVESFRYQFSPRLKAGLNAGFGYTNVRNGVNMSFLQPTVHVSLQATDKVSLGLEVGREQRTFRDSDVSRLNGSVYNASVAYRPFEPTILILTASRGVSVSYFEGQVTDGKEWGVTLQQRLFRRFTLTAGYAERDTDYLATRTDIEVARNDSNSTVSLRISTQLLERLSLGVIYQESDYDSNQAEFAYSSSQIGVELGYRF